MIYEDRSIPNDLLKGNYWNRSCEKHETGDLKETTFCGCREEYIYLQGTEIDYIKWSTNKWSLGDAEGPGLVQSRSAKEVHYSAPLRFGLADLEDTV